MSVRSKPKREGDAPAKPEHDANELPEGWTHCLVDDVFNVSSGGTPSRTEPKYWNGNVPWLSSGDIKTDEIEVGSEFITEAGLQNSTAKLCEAGSVVVVVRSGVLKHTLPVALLRRPAAINQDMKCFNAGNDELNRWLALALRTASRDILAENREGTTVQSVKSETLREFVFPLPPLAEQRRIVAKLEWLLGKVSSSQQRLSRVPGLLKRFRQSVLAAACSGKLTADWREENPDVDQPSELLPRLIRERANAWASKGTRKCPPPIPHDDENLPDIPQSWIWTSADAICSQVTDGEHIQPRYQSEGLPMLSAKHVRDGYVTVDGAGLIAEVDFKKCLERCEPKNGDILIVSVGATTGRAAIIENCPPFAIVRSVLHLQPLVPAYFLLRWLQTPWCLQWMMNASGASAQPHLYIKDTRRLPVPLPPLSEQQEIVRRVEKLFAFADQIEARLRQAQALVDRLTQSLLAKAFRGQLVPTEAELAHSENRSYEPASELLARIQLENSRSPSPGRGKSSKTSPVVEKSKRRSASRK